MSRSDPNWKQYIMTPITMRGASTRTRMENMECIDTFPPRQAGEPFSDYLNRVLY